MNKSLFPKIKIGQRIIKSAIAVFLCFVVSLFRQQQGIVFYSCIAAVLCIQQDTKNTKKVAWNRIVGTLIGGIMGMFVLQFIRSFISDEFLIIQYFVISFMIIVVIYITLLVRKPSASYISCVVFLSVCVSHASDVTPYLFALNRIFDTLIGIGVAYVVNTFHLPHVDHSDALFVVQMDRALVNKAGKIPSYTKIKFNQLLERGCRIMLISSKTPGVFMEQVKGINLRLPVVVLNGAACYDVRTQSYSRIVPIKKEAYKQIDALLEKESLNSFSYSVINHVMHVFYGGFHNEIEARQYELMRKEPFKNYVYSKVPQEHDVLYIHVIGECDKIYELYELMQKMDFWKDVQVSVSVDEDYFGYVDMEIVSVDVHKEQVVCEMMQKNNFHKLIVFGDSLKDEALMRVAEQSYVVDEAEESLKNLGEEIGSVENDAVAHKINELFHSRKI